MAEGGFTVKELQRLQKDMGRNVCARSFNERCKTEDFIVKLHIAMGEMDLMYKELFDGREKHIAFLEEAFRKISHGDEEQRTFIKTMKQDREKLKHLKDKVSEAAQKIKSLELQSEGLKSAYINISGHYTAAFGGLGSAITNQERLNKENDKLLEEKSNLLEANEALCEQIKKLEEYKSKSAKKIHSLIEDNQRLIDEKSSFKEKKKELRELVEALEDDKLSFKEWNEELENEKSSFKKDNERLRGLVEALEDDKLSFKEWNEGLHELIEELENERSSFKKDNERLRELVEGLNELVEGLEKSRSDLLEKQNELHLSLAKLDFEKIDLKASLKKMRQSLKETQEELHIEKAKNCPKPNIFAETALYMHEKGSLCDKIIELTRSKFGLEKQCKKLQSQIDELNKEKRGQLGFNLKVESVEKIDGKNIEEMQEEIESFNKKLHKYSDQISLELKVNNVTPVLKEASKEQDKKDVSAVVGATPVMNGDWCVEDKSDALQV